MKNVLKDQKMISIAEKLNEIEMDIFLKAIQLNDVSMKELEYLKKIHASKNQKAYVSDGIKHVDNNTIAERLYDRELGKLLFLANNKELLTKLNGLKILLRGPSGTGKTTLAQMFIKGISNKFVCEMINFEEMISHKMGQTQNNLLKLQKKIVIKAETDNIVIFIDEIDSIVINRENENDIGEHSRVIASFLKFLDAMPDNVIIIAATNVSNKIDKALMRRFNVKIDGNYADKHHLFTELNSHYGSLYSKNKFSQLLKDKKPDFKISEINDFINDFSIAKSLYKETDLFAFFCIKFEKKLNIDFDSLPVRTKSHVKRIRKYD